MTPDQLATKSDLAALTAEVRALRAAFEAARVQPQPAWLSVPDAARHFGKSAQTVRRWIAEGRIESKIVGTVRMVRVR